MKLFVGPSGYVYAARSINMEEANRRRQGMSTANLPELSAVCEAAVATAARRLPRWQPGQQNGRRVAVEIMVKMLGGPTK
ncbi:MAG: hypothetical protein EOO36_23730 [Cytophagaceae bacterium]|nr:MAG: hypothetical protein EOO36_23730 [Cytophagaceae bacterium]